MFSTAQQAYIESLIPTYAKEGYRYYVVHTDTNTGYYNSDPDLQFYFSKSKISAESAYSFRLPDDFVSVSVRSGNYSSNSSNARVTVESVSSARTVRIDQYEHIYTNAEFSGETLQPDISLSLRGETNVALQTVSFVLIVILIVSLLRRIIFRR